MPVSRTMAPRAHRIQVDGFSMDGEPGQEEVWISRKAFLNDPANVTLRASRSVLGRLIGALERDALVGVVNYDHVARQVAGVFAHRPGPFPTIEINIRRRDGQICPLGKVPPLDALRPCFFSDDLDFAQALDLDGLRTVAREMDAAIGVLGPHASIWPAHIAATGRYRPKDTDIVAPSRARVSETVHGGDGNSGEVDHAAERPRRARAAQKTGNAGDSTQQATGGNADPSPTHSTGSDGEQESAHPGASGDGPPLDPPDPPSDQTRASSHHGPGVSRAPTNGTSRFFAAREQVSGRAASLTAEGRSARRAIERLVRSDIPSAHGDPCPRLLPRRLAVEMVARSVRLARARMTLERGRVVIAPDVSGSCSACCADTLAAAMAVERAMSPQVAVVVTANGQCEDGTPLPKHPLIFDGMCRLLLVLGDWDGGLLYQQIANAGTKVVWLDSFGKAGGPRPSRDGARGMFAGWRVHPVKWDGIGNARDVAIALRAIASLGGSPGLDLAPLRRAASFAAGTVPAHADDHAPR